MKVILLAKNHEDAAKIIKKMRSMIRRNVLVDTINVDLPDDGSIYYVSVKELFWELGQKTFIRNQLPSYYYDIGAALTSMNGKTKIRIVNYLTKDFINPQYEYDFKRPETEELQRKLKLLSTKLKEADANEG